MSNRDSKIKYMGVKNMLEIYSDEFKLEVVKAYLESPHGIRVVARSYGLPSKNYIPEWMEQLKKKGLLPIDCEKNQNPLQLNVLKGLRMHMNPRRKLKERNILKKK